MKVVLGNGFRLEIDGQQIGEISDVRSVQDGASATPIVIPAGELVGEARLTIVKTAACGPTVLPFHLMEELIVRGSDLAQDRIEFDILGWNGADDLIEGGDLPREGIPPRRRGRFKRNARAARRGRK